MVTDGVGPLRDDVFCCETVLDSDVVGENVTVDDELTVRVCDFVGSFETVRDRVGDEVSENVGAFEIVDDVVQLH